MPTAPTQESDDIYNNPQLGAETIDALGGNDIITVSHSYDPVPVAIINVNAGDGNDSITVINGSNLIANVNGGNGNDILSAQPVSDSYILGVTLDQIVLIDETSLISAVINYSEVEHLVIVGTADTMNEDRVYWTTGDTVDEITVDGTLRDLPITVSTGGGNDKIYLNDPVGNGSRVIAGDGNDIVRGSSRDDILEGGVGEDTIEGGDGNDILIGGGNRDVLLGGAGSDIFRYSSVQDSSGATGIDTISDFVKGVDQIDLSAIGGLHWRIGAFTETPGEVRATLVGFQVDVNGDAIADMVVIALVGGHGLTASDFIF